MLITKLKARANQSNIFFPCLMKCWKKQSECWMKQSFNTIFSFFLENVTFFQNFKVTQTSPTFQHHKNGMLDEMLDWFPLALIKTYKNEPQYKYKPTFRLRICHVVVTGIFHGFWYDLALSFIFHSSLFFKISQNSNPNAVASLGEWLFTGALINSPSLQTEIIIINWVANA